MLGFDWLTPDLLSAFFQVLMIDIVLAGDNAIVVGLAAAGLPKDQRVKVIMLGIAAATVLRIVFALMTTQLMQVIGLLFAGGILLLWVSWKMWRELRAGHAAEVAAANAALDSADGSSQDPASKTAPELPRKSFAQAALQIVLADVSMSLDNVLAVAGAAREHPEVLVIGLILSVAFMGLAASLIANLLNRYRWIAYVGLVIILYVALAMIYEGGMQIMAAAQTL
ncbi:TerC family protein [Oceanibaculum nanhaiense]|jgi:YjbE family integral membrane protein|uniref:TerC family protein n=1 Tax=Oceanibaculum nanhaiense TaxID=1909734 RepID=UPI000A3A4C24|nr:TerC family protein [Oceanibaculum nanhaiense]MDM7945533.1 TerC family protein [Oceanibaculum nanhaiense]